MSQQAAAKYDAGKPQPHLVPDELVYGAARAFGYGVQKYAKWNWCKGMEWSRLRDAMERHVRAWFAGEETDPESGLSHLDHAAASLAMLMAHEARGLGVDDRPGSPELADKPLWTKGELQKAFEEAGKKAAQESIMDTPWWKLSSGYRLG